MKDLWTDARIEKLRSLWASGLSCSRIAHLVGGGATKNAVIAKAGRLGLPPHPSVANKAKTISEFEVTADQLRLAVWRRARLGARQTLKQLTVA